MMKVRTLDRCDFSDGEVSMREARHLTTIDIARCTVALVNWQSDFGEKVQSEFNCTINIPSKY